MAEQTIVVNISGYLREEHIHNLPEGPGIYFVYESKFNDIDQTIDLLRIIYIGDGLNIRQNVMSDSLQTEWKSLIYPGNEICFSAATIEGYYRPRVAAAYVFMHAPPANKENTKIFLYDRTTVISTGRTALLYPVITANRSNLQSINTPINFRRGTMIPARAIPLSREPDKPRRFASGE